MKTVKYCSKCGKPNNDSAMFCRSCGAELSSPGRRAAGGSAAGSAAGAGAAGRGTAGAAADPNAGLIRMLTVFTIVLGIVFVILALFVVTGDAGAGSSEAGSGQGAGGQAQDGTQAQDGSQAQNQAQDGSRNPANLDVIPDNALEFEGNYYWLYPSGIVSSWEEAERYCEEQGGHLAVITSDELNGVLYDYMRSLGYITAFFGYSDAQTEGNWKWVTGEQPSYTNWGTDEPNEEARTEDYAMFSTSEKNGKWNDSEFSYETSAFICQAGDNGIADQKVNKVIPQNAFRFNGHAYYIFDNGITSWSAAQQYCKSLGGDLAVIESRDENEALYQYMLDSGRTQVFIGFSDRQNEGDWVWVSGANSSFTDWGVNSEGEQEPNADSDYENFCEIDVRMHDGHWNDSRFGNDTKAYLCEWDLSD